MALLITFTLIALLGIAGLHLLWAARVWWPVRQEPQLARTVAGFAGLTHMPPPGACLVVAAAVLCVAGLLIGAVRAPATPLLMGALGAAGGVFVLRGGIAYTPAWARLTPEQPFRRLDTRYYAPLCLVIGGTLLLVAWP